MTQAQLPLIPNGTTLITDLLSVKKEDGQFVYFNGVMPVFSHAEKDKASFKMITAQFHVNGYCKQMDIVRAFGVTKVSVKRAVKKYREEGASSFFQPRICRGASVMTETVLQQAQERFDQGKDLTEVAQELKIKRDTLSKAVRQKKLHLLKKSNNDFATKSQRSETDHEAPMGNATTNVMGRVLASLGELNAVEPEFRCTYDVPNAGVLFALPALLATGLLKYTEQFFKLPKGYYGLDSLFILLAFMALSRVKSIESLRYNAPGEWGNIIGLDRIPEVRTLREKIHHLSDEEKSQQWGNELCQYWMNNAPEEACTLYIDGHVRVYNGKQTRLPRHYVARQKLCLRATSDYWVNAMDGQPFMVINQVVDPGLIQVLEKEIVPKLDELVPNQPDQVALKNNPLLHRFTLVFDREGYSPALFKRLEKEKIACMTYHKFPKEDWPQEEFKTYTVQLPHGEMTTYQLAERGTYFQKEKYWLREIRKLTEQGHQTAIITSNRCTDLTAVSVSMFARWSQENYFKYMREHYSLDRLASYSVEPINEPILCVNPEYRRIDNQIRSKIGKLNRIMAKYGAMHIEVPLEPEKMDSFIQAKSELQETIELAQHEINELKAQRKELEKHVNVEDLQEEDKFLKLSTQSKYLIDSLKMIAYRAETAMANCLREFMPHQNEARKVLQTLYQSEADIIPDHKQGTLTVLLHHMANKSMDRAIEKMCDELNSTETVFPRTNLRLVLKVGSK